MCRNAPKQVKPAEPAKAHQPQQRAARPGFEVPHAALLQAAAGLSASAPAGISPPPAWHPLFSSWQVRLCHLFYAMLTACTGRPAPACMYVQPLMIEQCCVAVFLVTQGMKLGIVMHVTGCLVLKTLWSCRCPCQWSSRLATQVGLCLRGLLTLNVLTTAERVLSA